MLVVGLTGGIATGKSTVVRAFRNLGATVIDSDALVHRALTRGGEAYESVVRAFGPGVLDGSGEIDRSSLGEIVFRDESRLRELNQIVHPVVLRQIEHELAKQRESGRHVVIVDMPLLYEIGWDKRCDSVVVVYASPEQQLDRLCRRNGLGEAEARARLNAQWPVAGKADRANLVIDNSGTVEDTLSQVARIWNELDSRTSPAGTPNST